MLTKADRHACPYPMCQIMGRDSEYISESNSETWTACKLVEMQPHDKTRHNKL